jgi:hypothetical protein
MLDNATPAMRDRLASHVDFLALVDLDRRPLTFTTTRGKRKYAKARREKHAARGLCINGAKHGTADHGRLCKACRETHRRSA